MTDLESRALLPAGLRDILSPDAEREAEVVHRLMSFFGDHGYLRVKPPLLEFEESLLSGSGTAVAHQTFRMMDPVSQRMLAVRPDMTLQVARIATSRLRSAERPLRLSYAGQVLRVKGSQLRPERQFGQAGLELIGSEAPMADAEVVVLVARALAWLGVREVSVDLTLPTLVPAVLADHGVQADGALREALDHKDAAAVVQLAGTAAGTLEALIAGAGPAERAFEILDGLPLSPAAATERDRLAAIVSLIRGAAPELVITIDPVENRNFEYHCGPSFTLFSRGVPAELGRGGRYLVAGREPATGASLFMDTVLGALPAASARERVYVPLGTPTSVSDRLRSAGWVTVAGLEMATDHLREAVRQGCSSFVTPEGVVRSTTERK